MPEPFTRSIISTFLLSYEETVVLLIVLNLFLHCIYGSKKKKPSNCCKGCSSKRYNTETSMISHMCSEPLGYS